MYDFVGTPSDRAVGEVVTSCGDHWYLLGIGRASSRGIRAGSDRSLVLVEAVVTLHD